MISRRAAFKAGIGLTTAIGGAGLLVPALEGVAAASDLDPNSIEKFQVAMPRPKVLRPTFSTGLASYYTVTMREVAREIVPGKPTTVWTYNGQFPGPVIRARSGERVVVRQINRLSVPTSVHLHGAHVPQSSDGGPMDLIAPHGGQKVYTYPNHQSHANLWFHDHSHHTESENVFRGLAGFYLLTDHTERRLNLPRGSYDVPIALRDARFDAEGQFVYVMGDFLKRSVILANGKPWPYFDVAARKYRFRLFNQSNQRFFTLRLSDGSQMQQIGTDGGLLPEPYATSTVSLSSGERADVVVDFSRYPVGTTVELVNNDTGPAAQVMQFRVTRRAHDRSSVPPVLRSLPALAKPTVERSFVLKMDEAVGPDTKAWINGKVYDHQRIDTEIQYGATEVWTVSNANQRAPHNFHLHLVQFRVLERNGIPVTSGPEFGLKDTVKIMPGETVKLQATFTGYRGTYLYHCHMLDHSAMGMMANMKIV
ncbi:multicopper oxidase family protein [Streptomyces sp. NPDC006879]|uniref:multicopper oxidase family protein n=1 Tax=Streptomyces sp. NPDC006879 TaxID=3364767 RepID=UPI0036CE6A34